MKQILHHFRVRPIDTPELSLRGFGVQEAANPSFVNRPHGIETYLMVYFYDEVTLTIGDQDQLFPSGTFIIWPPNTKHNFGNGRKRWRHSWMLVEGRFVEQQITDLKLPCSVPLRLMVSGIMEKTFLDIEHEITAHHPASVDIVRNLLQIFLIEIERLVHPRQPEHSTPQAYLAVKTYMDQHFDRPTNLGQLSSMVHRSDARFCVTFKKYFGLPPIDYLIHLRMTRAEFLLRDYNLTISDIAARVGYDDIYYFSRVFKKHFGVSPSLMRKRFD